MNIIDKGENDFTLSEVFTDFMRDENDKVMTAAVQLYETCRTNEMSSVASITASLQLILNCADELAECNEQFEFVEIVEAVASVLVGTARQNIITTKVSVNQ